MASAFAARAGPAPTAVALPRRRGTCRQQRRAAARALELADSNGTVTNERLAQQPWTQPGHRGAWLSAQPEGAQTALVAGITALGAVMTYFACTSWGPWICETVPLMERYMFDAPWINAPLFIAAGVGHFAAHQEFCKFYPHQGAWGFWILPGSPSFHVNWTGIAEIAGGLGLLVGKLDPSWAPDWLFQASAFGLFLLVLVVTPSNLYMWTHNAAPMPEEDIDKIGAIPWPFHAIRGLLQVVLLSTFFGLAIHNY